jgi:hypothetical protein
MVAKRFSLFTKAFATCFLVSPLGEACNTSECAWLDEISLIQVETRTVKRATPSGTQKKHSDQQDTPEEFESDILDKSSDSSQEITVNGLAPSPDGSWSVDVGFFKFGSGGFDIVPQFKVGFQCPNLNISAGVGDVRNGLKVSAGAHANIHFCTVGNSLSELFRSIDCDVKGCKTALRKVKSILMNEDTGDDIAKKLGTSGDEVLDMLEAKDEEMKLVVGASTGIGVSAEAKLGWKDTEGYHMVGAGGEVAAGLDVGFSVFAGIHEDGHGFKIAVDIGTFDFAFEFGVREVKHKKHGR